jgi:hypothetical protein
MLRWLLLFLALACPASARSVLTNGAPSAAGCTAYTGPGDIIPGASVWAGTYGYNCAYAAPGTNPAYTLRNSTTSATATINILSTGALDVATATTFAGTDAVCTGTISGITMTISGCASGTLRVNDPISGASIAQPNNIVSFGTGLGGAGTYTIALASTVSTPETITATAALFITEKFDQTGNGHNWTQADVPSQPLLMLNCGIGVPCEIMLPGWLEAFSVAVANPFTFVASAFRRAGFTTAGLIIFSQGANVQLSSETTVNTARIFGGSAVVDATASDLAWHVLQGVFGASTSTINVDNAAIVTSPAGTAAVSGDMTTGADTSAGNKYPGNITHIGIWPFAFTGSQQTSMCHIASTIEGAAVSC